MSTTLVELAKRLPSRLDRWVPQIIAAELCYGVDPYWLAAVLDQESNGGEMLAPKGPKGKGDHGHGHGLFQIDDRSHGPLAQSLRGQSFLEAVFDDGTPLWHDPTFQAMYATRLLRRNLELLGNDYLAAVAAYNAGAGRIRKTVAALPKEHTIEQRIKALDAVTFAKAYLSSVLDRRNSFLSTTTA